MSYSLYVILYHMVYMGVVFLISDFCHMLFVYPKLYPKCHMFFSSPLLLYIVFYHNFYKIEIKIEINIEDKILRKIWEKKFKSTQTKIEKRRDWADHFGLGKI